MPHIPTWRFPIVTSYLHPLCPTSQPEDFPLLLVTFIPCAPHHNQKISHCHQLPSFPVPHIPTWRFPIVTSYLHPLCPTSQPEDFPLSLVTFIPCAPHPNLTISHCHQLPSSPVPHIPTWRFPIVTSYLHPLCPTSQPDDFPLSLVNFIPCAPHPNLTISHCH